MARGKTGARFWKLGRKVVHNQQDGRGVAESPRPSRFPVVLACEMIATQRAHIFLICRIYVSGVLSAKLPCRQGRPTNRRAVFR